jgi:Macrocin-O-methyltransferase (TylF)
MIQFGLRQNSAHAFMRYLLGGFKRFLTKIGACCPPLRLRQLQAALNYLKLGRWMRDHQINLLRLPHRQDVFDCVATRVQDKRTLYLEFGVFEGSATRYWSGRLRHPEAQLHGFDSFEGLPEAWGPHQKGHFDTEGRIPQIDDPRVKFFKGWFDQTLPHYQVPEHDVLVLVMDADLYSSTIYVLRQLRPHIRPGTFIYFDEMHEVEHEPRAFDEFMRESGLGFRCIAVDRTMSYAFFECDAATPSGADQCGRWPLVENH